MDDNDGHCYKAKLIAVMGSNLLPGRLQCNQKLCHERPGMTSSFDKVEMVTRIHVFYKKR